MSENRKVKVPRISGSVAVIGVVSGSRVNALGVHAIEQASGRQQVRLAVEREGHGSPSGLDCEPCCAAARRAVNSTPTFHRDHASGTMPDMVDRAELVDTIAGFTLFAD